MRKEIEIEKAGVAVGRIAKTREWYIRLTLTENTSGAREKFCENIKQVCQKKTEIEIKDRYATIVIKGLDEITTIEEVVESVQAELQEAGVVTLIKPYAKRNNLKGSAKTALIGVEVKAAQWLTHIQK